MIYDSRPALWNFAFFYILNIEYRTRNFEQQKFFKAIRQYFSLRYSAVHILAHLITGR